MENFLERLHKKPDHHKKRFALLASSTITLFIFALWSLATFGINRESVITKTETEVGPLESFRSSLASSFEALRSSLEDLKNGTLEIYGQ